MGHSPPGCARQFLWPSSAWPERAKSDEEAIASVLQITGGNFRLLARLLTQIARVLEVNEADEVTVAIVEAARESLVIGAA